MKNNEGIADYFTRMPTLINLIKNCGKKFADRDIIDKVLRTLTTRFDHIVVGIEESKNPDALKIEELQGTLRLINKG